MPFQFNNENGINIITLEGSIEFLKAHELEKTLERLLEEIISHEASPPILFDFSELTYIDSYGLGILLRWKQLCTKNKILYAFTNLKGQVRNQFESAQVATAFPLYDDIDDAKYYLKENA